LRSPACTWAQRKEGVDCKSYSVFASSILSNLGIKHFIRQVRQPYFYPEEFTHVYVVVPKDQDVIDYSKNAPTFVLDATKHQNTEGSFIEKVDLYMVKLKHIGLNAPQDGRTQKIAENFELFSRKLLQYGISLTTVNSIRAHVNKFTSSGIDPSFKVTRGGLVIAGKFFPLHFTKDPQVSEQGLGFVTMATATAAMEFLPPDFLNNTFGSIFANGFDLSCWNASYSESKATAALEMDIPFLLDTYSGFSKNPNTTTLNKFLNGIAGYISDSVNGQRSKFAECTRKGYALRQKGAEGARDQVLSQVKRAFTLTPTGKVNGHIDTNMPSIPNKPYRWGSAFDRAYTYDYESYRIAPISKPTQAPTNYTPASGNNNQQPSGENIGNLNNTGGSKSNTGLIIGGVALAALPLLFMMKGNPVKAKTTKKASK